MAHLLSCLVIYATVIGRSVMSYASSGLIVVLCEVDFVVEESGLSGCGGYDGDLPCCQPVSRLCGEGRTHRLAVQQQYLHLGRVGPGLPVSGRHHLGDVAGDGLKDIHVSDVMMQLLHWVKDGAMVSKVSDV